LALLLEASDLEAALPYSRAVQVLYSAFRAFAEGTYRFPQRLVLDGSHGLLVAMPALDESSMAVKVATVHPGNPDLGLPSVQATVLLMDARTGELQGILDGTVLTLIRTAATSAVATDVLANPGPADLSVLGSGPLALAHIRALAEVRPLRSVRIYSPRLFARWATIATTLEPLGVDFGAMGSPESAVEGASIVVLATSAREPVLRWEWVSPGAHINAVGSHSPNAREVDTETIAKGRIFCDSVEACWAEAGDLLIPEREHAIDRTHAAISIGDVLLGRAAGRAAREEVTLFKSVGLAFEDLCAAAAAWEASTSLGLGTKWPQEFVGRVTSISPHRTT